MDDARAPSAAARELLAAEYDNCGATKLAQIVRENLDDDGFGISRKCALRAIEKALTRPAPAGEGLAAEIEALLRDVIIAAGGVANPGCSIDFLRCAPAEVEALHAKWKALAKAPVSGDGFHLDRRAACRYYGYDDEKDLNYWGDRSKHNDVERLAEFLRRHRLGLTSDERENG